MNAPRLVFTFLFALISAQAQDGATRADWPSYGGSHLAWRYSALDQINTKNVKKLAPVWAFQTGDYDQGLQSTPIVIDGVLYLSTTHSQMFALDAATEAALAVQVSGAARRGGTTFRIADSPWARARCSSERTTITSWRSIRRPASSRGRRRQRFAPVRMQHHRRAAVVKDKVIVGGPAAMALRGYLTAFDAKTGR